MDSIQVEVILDHLKMAYEELMPFNKHIGIKVDSISTKGIVIKIDMRNELVGNHEKNILHGGVIATVLDFTGSAITHLHILNEMKDATLEKLIKRIVHMGTIDMRVDYIRPGRGAHFLATGHILRLGHSVAVVRTELKNDEGVLIAIGTSTYSVG